MAKFKLKETESRVFLDTAIFSFGLMSDGVSTKFGYKLYCAVGWQYIDLYCPIWGEELVFLIEELKKLESSYDYKRRFTFKSRWSKTSIEFCGFDEKKGVKVMSYFFGFFYVKQNPEDAYIDKSVINTLIINLEKCVINHDKSIPTKINAKNP